MIGKTLAHFRVTDKLGEGGMGEVYRAQDSKLGREVAIKVLPALFAEDAERMARFSREAQVLASLNHPNIAGIFQVEHEDDAHFLVMELVEGETLAERIQRGPIPVEEALQIALQVIAGLEEAHDLGIVHRDLKPANIKITPKGQVKVLDFGLAKALADDPASSGSGPVPMVTQSPTLTAEMTGAGMLLGTAAYMSPEQARGQVADRRADIWAFGIVLMEMLTGRTVFAAETVSDTLAGVLARDPEWNKLPESTPRAIKHLLDRCLAKETRNRLQAIGEARIQIEAFLENPEEEEIQGAGVVPVAVPLWKRLAPWGLAAALALAFVGALSGWIGGRDEAPPRTVRSSLALLEGKTLHQGYGSPLVLSPNGERIAFIYQDGPAHEIFLRALDQWEGTALTEGRGPERPYHPFFSPDGQWLGFASPDALKKVPVSGGTPIKLCDVSLSRGASWGPDGTIVLAPNPGSGLVLVPDAGGEPQPLTELDADRSEATHRWPQFLPGGEQILFTAHSSQSDFDGARIEVLDLDSQERRVIHEGGTYGRYVDSGHLVYFNQGTLFAMPFDLDRLEATGSAAPVIQEVGGSVEGGAYYDVSENGELVFTASSAVSSSELRPVWVTRDGQIEPIFGEERDFRNPRLSPDGRFLAVGIRLDGNTDIWVYDLERDVPTRLTFDEADDDIPVWSPDGQFIVFSSERTGGTSNIFRKAADGSGDLEQLTDSERAVQAWSWSPDGRRMAIMEFNQETVVDISILTIETGEIEPFQHTAFVEYAPVFSPDGRYLLYGTNESGDWEGFVRPVDGSRGKWQISSIGGVYPTWSSDGQEILIGAPGGVIYSVPVDSRDGSFRVGRPQELFSGNFADLTLDNNMFDVTPDGQRFVLFEGEVQMEITGHQHLSLVSNWFAELERTFSR
jgi:serine/threonine-protein kinase